MRAVNALLGLVTVLLGCHNAPSSAHGSDHASDGAATPLVNAVTTALDHRTRGWLQGRQYAYRVHMVTDVVVGKEGSPMDLTIDGMVVATPSEVSDDRATIFLAFRDMRLGGAVAASGERSNAVERQLDESGAFFTLEGGRFVEFQVASDLTPLGINAYREVASRLQFARSSDDVATYTAQEFDTTGPYVATYSGAGLVWQKHKERYVGLLSSARPGASRPIGLIPEIVSSQGEVSLGESGRPLRVQGTDHVLVKGAQAPMSASTTIALSAEHDDKAPAPAPDWNGLMAHMSRIRAGEPFAGKQTANALDSARIHGMHFDELVAQMESRAKAEVKNRHSTPQSPPASSADQRAREDDVKAVAATFSAMAAVFRTEPNTVAEAVQRIRAGSPASRDIVAALGSASSQSAQQALLELLHDHAVDGKLHNAIMLALARAPRPSEQSIELFRNMLVNDPYNMQALYGLGSFARQLDEQGMAAQAKVITETLVERLTSASTPSQLVVTLRALMNSGSNLAVDAVAKKLEDQRDDVRAAAVKALQAMNDARVDELIAKRLALDTSNEVRVAAADAVMVREPSDTLAAALTKSATQAGDPTVRFRAVEVLGLWMKRRPDVRPTLTGISERDPEARIRELAKSELDAKPVETTAL